MSLHTHIHTKAVICTTSGGFLCIHTLISISMYISTSICKYAYIYEHTRKKWNIQQLLVPCVYIHPISMSLSKSTSISIYLYTCIHTQTHMKDMKCIIPADFLCARDGRWHPAA